MTVPMVSTVDDSINGIRYSNLPRQESASSDSSTEDESDSGITINKPSNRRTTQSINEEQEELLNDLLKKHGANDTRAWQALGLSAVLWCLGVASILYTHSWWAVLLTSFSLVRNFIVLHDACHLSFFESYVNNVRLAQVMQVSKCSSVPSPCSLYSPLSLSGPLAALVLLSMQHFSGREWKTWQVNHNHHHAHLGDVVVVDNSVTIWFSEAEYERMPLWKKVPFRIVRDPIVFFPVASLWVFFIFDFRVNFMSVHAIPIAIGLVTNNFKSFFVLYTVAMWIAGTIGLAIFHLQHQVNTPYRVHSDKRSGVDAGLYGSTMLSIWFPFSLMTHGIEFHHIHHASTRVPGYHLAACHAEGEKLGLWGEINRVGGLRAFLSMFHTLFRGDVKVSPHEHHVRRPSVNKDGTKVKKNQQEIKPEEDFPSFTTFWPYRRSACTIRVRRGG